MVKTMVKSDGNGGYIVDKKLWSMVMALIVLLSGVIVWGAESIVTDVKDNTKSNAVQSEQIKNLIDQRREMLDILSKMNDKLDRALQK